MTLRSFFSRRGDDAATDDTQYADRADIARFNEARTDSERMRVIDGVRARARADRR